MKLAIALAGLLAAASCSSSPSPEPVEPAPTPAEPAPAEPAPAAAEGDIGEGIAWADKSHDQKKAFMKARVMPAMAALWKESPEPEEEVTCATCHGPGAMEGKFDMPNADLYPLDPTNQFAAHQDDADWLQFMGTKVVPTMAQTLGVDPYDPATQKGFGCFSCHGLATK